MGSGMYTRDQFVGGKEDSKILNTLDKYTTEKKASGQKTLDAQKGE